jgi:hypothetical protein
MKVYKKDMKMFQASHLSVKPADGTVVLQAARCTMQSTRNCTTYTG